MKMNRDFDGILPPGHYGLSRLGYETVKTNRRLGTNVCKYDIIPGALWFITVWVRDGEYTGWYESVKANRCTLINCTCMQLRIYVNYSGIKALLICF